MEREGIREDRENKGKNWLCLVFEGLEIERDERESELREGEKSTCHTRGKE